MEKSKKQPFLYDYQMNAVNHMRNGCILNGGVGSGKSRTGLYYYFKENGGSYIDEYVEMKKKPQDLYIITTARKRDTLEWEEELLNYHMTNKRELSYYDHDVIIDSWNNIKKYTDVKNAFFIFDEDRVTGSGAWVKAFYKIAKNNNWIILSATPGDTWEQYIPVFVANGFYRNKTEFTRAHCIYSRYTKYPQIERYIGIRRLIRLREKILVDMEIDRHTIPHHIDVYVGYDKKKYKDTMKYRWDPYKNVPIEQASNLCYILRRIVNEDDERATALMEILDKVDKAIIFYNFDYELDILRNLFWGDDDSIEPADDLNKFEVAEWNGHMHQEIPNSDRWVYLVQYTAGAEGWNCIKTNTIIFYSQNYSYKTLNQAQGRIDRLNTPYTDLHYYHLKSHSSIDLAINRALKNKKNFNEGKWAGHLKGEENGTR